jgi:hemerythrin
MTKTELANGMSLVEIPGAQLSILCGCPENAVKFLIKGRFIREVERDGLRFETGPNAILLSELPVQGGRFRNLGEFPVLQMLYKQGLIVPGHPNNKGLRPMVIGMRDQVEAQAAYIYAGNYGLGSVEELVAAGLSRDKAEEQFRMKLRFAFGRIRKTDELLELRVIDSHAVELRGGAFVRRLGVNRYEFLHDGESAVVDLSPPAGALPSLPYSLPFGSISRDYFSVVHLGEGDGWDTGRPCMSSLIVFRGEPYLIDTGPDIEASLEAVGIGVNGLRGIFQTHAHDDHFVGITAFLRAESRLRYYAVPWVRASVERKLKAIAGIDDRDFRRCFEVHDLVEGSWNDLDGLEVLPTMSPHPVETTILRFRAGASEGKRSYAHLADLASFAVLDSMIEADPARPGISADLAARSKKAYLEPADVKKVDVGGGMIHGSASDFDEDASGLLLLSHTSAPPILAEGARGVVADFGDENRLIPGKEDYSRPLALGYLERLFPTAREGSLEELLACERFGIEAGVELQAEGSASDFVYLVLSGSLLRSSSSGRRQRRVSSGSLVGVLDCLAKRASSFSFRSRSRVEALRIPGAVFCDFLRRASLEAIMEELCETMVLLDDCPVLEGLSSMSALSDIASSCVPEEVEAGRSLVCGERPGLCVIVEGKAVLVAGGRRVGLLGRGEAFGEEALLSEGCCLFDALALEKSFVYRIPREAIEDKPLLLWRLRELRDARLATVEAAFDFVWRPEYSVGHSSVDEEHRKLFALIDELDKSLSAAEACPDGAALIEGLDSFASSHFATEEALMLSSGCPYLASHRLEHESLRERLGAHRRRFDCGDAEALADLDGFLKDWVLRHVLLVDRQYMPYLAAADRAPLSR